MPLKWCSYRWAGKPKHLSVIWSILSKLAKVGHYQPIHHYKPISPAKPSFFPAYPWANFCLPHCASRVFFFPVQDFPPYGVVYCSFNALVIFCINLSFTVVSCSELSSPTNGSMKCQNPLGSFNYRSTCAFTCDAGYRLVPSSPTSLQCGASGRWSGSQPQCSGMTLTWILC